MNRLYDFGRESFLNGDISWMRDTIRVLLIKQILVDGINYEPNFETDRYVMDIPMGARIATSPPLVAKSVNAGVANSNKVIFQQFLKVLK